MDNDCTLETDLNSSIILQSVRWIQIVVALAVIILVSYITCYHLSQTILDSITIWFIKIVFVNCAVYSTGIGLIILYIKKSELCVSYMQQCCIGVVFTSESAFVIARIAAVAPCDAVIPKSICLFRILASSATPVFVLIHLSITIQQALSTLRYPLRVQKIVARVCTFTTYCYVIIYGCVVYHKEQFTGTTAFCSSFTPNGEVLSRKFQRVRNLYAMEQYITIVALHSVTHIIHFCLYSFTFYYRPNYTQTQFTILHAVVNIVPYYCLIGPLTFLVLIKLGRFQRQDHVRSMIATMHSSNTQEMYFKGLRDAWNQ